ncbi:C-type lectin domain family 2 member B-like [Podarcis raffonei]|uniref:C-type lectin domain family 2 member B-like n=1 Tax=Podarcis raffonei TaxID=65483 RepID=UPI0023294E19|nr:C-type lectin domain family 2 member B-like [Podarcis raffonei]
MIEEQVDYTAALSVFKRGISTALIICLFYFLSENQQRTIIIAVIISILFILWWAAQYTNQPYSEVSSVRACPALWINYEGKCYFFSEEKGDWASSQIFCDSHNSVLAVIDSEQEKAFILRYIRDTGHWIGLRKDSGQTWKWGNGQEFKNTLELKEDGECAFLSTDIAVSDCHVARNWICSQPDTYTRSRS